MALKTVRDSPSKQGGPSNIAAAPFQANSDLSEGDAAPKDADEELQCPNDPFQLGRIPQANHATQYQDTSMIVARSPNTHTFKDSNTSPPTAPIPNAPASTIAYLSQHFSPLVFHPDMYTRVCFEVRLSRDRQGLVYTMNLEEGLHLEAFVRGVQTRIGWLGGPTQPYRVVADLDWLGRRQVIAWAGNNDTLLSEIKAWPWEEADGRHWRCAIPIYLE